MSNYNTPIYDSWEDYFDGYDVPMLNKEPDKKDFEARRAYEQAFLNAAPEITVYKRQNPMFEHHFDGKCTQIDDETTARIIAEAEEYNRDVLNEFNKKANTPKIEVVTNQPGEVKVIYNLQPSVESVTVPVEMKADESVNPVEVTEVAEASEFEADYVKDSDVTEEMVQTINPKDYVALIQTTYEHIGDIEIEFVEGFEGIGEVTDVENITGIEDFDMAIYVIEKYAEYITKVDIIYYNKEPEPVSVGDTEISEDVEKEEVVEAVESVEEETVETTEVAEPEVVEEKLSKKVAAKKTAAKKSTTKKPAAKKTTKKK